MIKWLMLVLLLANNAYSQEMMTKVIKLNYMQANQVIQLIQPLMQTGEKLSGSGHTLIVNVSPQTLTQIRDVLHQIDVPPATFQVIVHQDGPDWLSPRNGNSVSYSTQSQSETLRTQSVQVMNGESAFVSTGLEVPVVTAVGAGFYAGVSYQQRQVKNGLLVSPVMEGSRVRLKVKRIREQVNPSGGQYFDNQQLDTTLLVPLNKWVSLGSAQGWQKTDSSTTVYTAGRTFQQNATVYVKVSIVGMP